MGFLTVSHYKLSVANLPPAGYIISSSETTVNIAAGSATEVSLLRENSSLIFLVCNKVIFYQFAKMKSMTKQK